MSHVNLVATLNLYVDVIGETGDVFVVWQADNIIDHWNKNTW